MIILYGNMHRAVAVEDSREGVVDTSICTPFIADTVEIKLQFVTWTVNGEDRSARSLLVGCISAPTRKELVGDVLYTPYLFTYVGADKVEEADKAKTFPEDAGTKERAQRRQCVSERSSATH